MSRGSGTRRALLLLLLLGVGVVAPGHASAADTQQGIQSATKTFHLNFHPPSVICVGSSTQVSVTALFDMDVSLAGGGTQHYADHVLPGVTIDASVEDTGIASVSPATSSAGILPNPNDLLAPGQLGSPYAQLATVVFTLRGIKAGNTNLYLKAHIPSSISGAANTTVQPVVPFRVTQCRYKVTVASLTSFTAPGLTSILVSVATGEMQIVDTSGESGAYRGDANVDWTMNSFSPMCSHEQNVTDHPAHLTGQLSPDSTLSVQLDYEPFQMETVNCGSGSTGSFPVPPVTIKISGDSGSEYRSLSFKVGNEPMSGHTLIVVTPIQGP